MRPVIRLFASSLLLAVLMGCTSTARSTRPIPDRTATAPPALALPTSTPARRAGTAAGAATPSTCPVTLPNGNAPPGESPAPDFYGNGRVWTGLYPAGTVSITPADVRSDGTFDVKFYWWRGIQGQLAIRGRRLDAPAPPLQAIIPTGYGDIGFQSTALIFPSAGCWEVTGTVSGKGGEASLTFVTRVARVGSGATPQPLSSPGAATTTPHAPVHTSPTGATSSCPVTLPNGNLPPGEKPPPPGHPDAHHGNGRLWTALQPDGKTMVKPDQIDPDGTLDVKFPWWRGPGVRGPLTITGRRLDAPAPSLRADIPSGYGDTGFQASGILFPTVGCWEVTGRAGDASLTFVTLVMKVK